MGRTNTCNENHVADSEPEIFIIYNDIVDISSEKKHKNEVRKRYTLE